MRCFYSTAQIMMFNVLLLIFSLITVTVVSAQLPFVVIPDGAIFGSLRQTLGGKTYAAFEGIPYASPPVGSLRLAEPQPVKPWSGILNGTRTSRVCPQQEGVIRWEQDEDCLYLNVYVPQQASTKEDRPNRRPYNVIVFIHPGGYSLFTGNTIGPQYLFDYSGTEILVTFNYRLGLLGFLSLGDEVIPGNFGMKDQVAALKWVQRNIFYFGGDPSKVTLAGLSVGGSSVNFHMMSPLSRGLFHNAISGSGTALTTFALSTNATAKSLDAVASLNCTRSSSMEILSCLRELPFESFRTALLPFVVYLLSPITPFGAVVEPCIKGAFLSEHPEKLVAEGRIYNVPWLITINANEGLFPGVVNLANPAEMDNLMQNWRTLFVPLLNLQFTIPDHLLEPTVMKIKQFYFGNDAVAPNTSTNFINMLTDRLFANGIKMSAQLQGAICQAPIYMYRFNYRGQRSITEELTRTDTNYGVGHFDDSFYVIYDSIFQPYEKKITVDDDMTKLITTIWTSFARNSVPTVGVTPAQRQTRWYPMPCKVDMLIYLNINSPYDIQLVQTSENKTRSFWNSLPFIPFGGYRSCIPTPQYYHYPHYHSNYHYPLTRNF